MALPRLFHADRRLRLTGKSSAQLPQLGAGAHFAVEEKAVHDGFERNRQIDVIANEIVGYAAAEPIVPARGIEPQQMVAVFIGFADPQFADYTAFGKNVLHSEGLLTLSSTGPS